MSRAKYHAVFYNNILQAVYDSLQEAQALADDAKQGEFYTPISDSVEVVSGLHNIRRKSGYSLQELRDDTITREE